MVDGVCYLGNHSVDNFINFDLFVRLVNYCGYLWIILKLSALGTAASHVQPFPTISQRFGLLFLIGFNLYKLSASWLLFLLIRFDNG